MGLYCKEFPQDVVLLLKSLILYKNNLSSTLEIYEAKEKVFRTERKLNFYLQINLT